MAGKITEVRLPFTKMSFTPDVPSTALGPNEYNAGENVETDVRGIRSTLGDQAILATVPGTPTYISGGFRGDTYFWFIVATTEGYWWASKGGAWQDITPTHGTFTYLQNTNITEAWNGTIPFFNDGINPPMFWGDGDAKMTMYSNILPQDINNIVTISPTVQQIQLVNTLTAAPYIAGDQITISGVNSYYNGTFTVVSSTTSTINYTASPAAAYPNNGGSVAPTYSWNFNSDWKSVSAGFMRLYNTPNVGCILVAGDLTATLLDNSIVEYPVTIQWSQAFGLNQAPLTWTPTITNVANQLEVPLRGRALDAFPSNGQFFLCSYWDTVVFSPLNYATTSTPILGVRLYNQGRGLLTSNAWGNTDKMVYGIDARDVWAFDGSNFVGIGNQRVKNWFFDQLDQQYYDRVFMEVNTQKNQIEIYYPDSSAIGGVPNKMLSYRYDLDIWNAPRDVTSATMACESPVWTYNGSAWTSQLASRTLVYARGTANVSIVQKDQGYSFVGNTAISSYFRRDNIKMINDYSGKTFVHRILPEVVNLDGKGIPLYPSTGNISVTIEGANSVGSAPAATTAVEMQINTDNPWTQMNQNAHRVNTIELSNTSSTDAWMCSATTWQFTQVEDDR